MPADQPIKYNSQLQKDQSDDSSAPVTQRVILYGWDTQNLQKVRVTLNPDGSFQQSSAEYKAEYDFDANNTYIFVGEAIPGTAQAAAVWRIKKITFDANGNPTATLWANGTSTFDKSWTHHNDGTYTYTNS